MAKATKTKEELEKLLKKKFNNKRPTNEELRELKAAYKEGRINHNAKELAKEILKDLK